MALETLHGILHFAKMAAAPSPTIIGRYALFDRIAAGGMASVHLGRLFGEGGFTRTVAIKRLHAQLALDPDFASMLLDEARLCARIHHPNVVATLDVVSAEAELFLVMEYVVGESLVHLLRASEASPDRASPALVASVMSGVLHGLHAAHEATSDRGELLGIVHRDVSPHNVLVGVDGVARVLDFGVAKALGRVHTTEEGTLKGKVSYMAPEQISEGI
jgi:serine/threonine-protein kinase